MVASIVHQLTRKLSDQQIQSSSYAPYFVDHTTGVYPTAASGFPWSAASMEVKGDVIADLTEDLAAEQKGEEAVLAFAAAHGCEATAEEIEEFVKAKLAEDEEVSLDDLDQVAGGDTINHGKKEEHHERINIGTINIGTK